MRRDIVALIAILILLVIGVLLWTANKQAGETEEEPVASGQEPAEEEGDDEEEVVLEDTDGDGIEDEAEAAAEEDPAVSENANIIVAEPVATQRVGAHSLVIVGEARVYENTYNWRVKDEDGDVLDEGFGTADAADIGLYGNFVVYASYIATPGEAGTVEVFNTSARDGSEENMVTIPVEFARERTGKVFLTNGDLAGAGDECNEVFGVDRLIIDSVLPTVRLRAALWILLAGGVSGEETSDGYTTSIANDVRINDIRVNPITKVATIDFSDEIDVGGSCNVAAIRLQIEETVKSIMGSAYTTVITVDGGTAAEALQP